MRVVLCDMMRLWRGGQRQFVLLAEGLARRGEDVLCIVRSGSPLQEHLQRKGLPHKAISVAFEADITAAWRIGEFCRRFNAQLIHSHDSHSHWLAGLAALWLRIPHIVSRRVDFHIFRHGWGFSWFKYRYFADGYIAVSRAAADVLKNCGVPESKIFVVQSGLPLHPPRRRDIRSVLGLPPDTTVVGTVGDMVPHKGHWVFIEAAANIRLPDVHFVIIGGGPLHPRLKALISKKNLQSRFHLAGRLSAAEEFVGSFDIFVMSSVQEGLGTSVLDAYRHGVAVVATKAGGLAEVVEDGVSGLLVEVGDARALARAIMKVLEDGRLRKRLVAGGKELLKNRFSADIMVERTLSVYRRYVEVPRRCYRRRT